MNKPNILIIGAGITGLVLAQALKKYSIPFCVYERDPDLYHRGKGWALYLHWCLPDLLSLLPQHLIDRLPETYVDPVATAKGENGRFTFFDLSTGEAKWQVPPAKRLRMSRERLRRLLLDGIEVQWGKQLDAVSTSSPQGISAHFQDGTSALGTHLVGCDGSRSRARTLLCALRGSRSKNHSLPVRLLGASVLCCPSIGRVMQERDPFCFQGGDPTTDSFLFFSFLDTPAHNERLSGGRDMFDCQIIVSWPFRPGFLGQSEPTEIPATNEDRLRLMRVITDGWISPYRDVVQNIPDETPIQQIRLEDWPPQEGSWETFDGRATLIGDAAHAMTMFRGEAANHGITDVARWLEHFLPVLRSSAIDDEAGLKDACNAYEHEMIARTHPAVLLSRRACLDAHDYQRIDDRSPLVSKRRS